MEWIVVAQHLLGGCITTYGCCFHHTHDPPTSRIIDDTMSRQAIFFKKIACQFQCTPIDAENVLEISLGRVAITTRQ